MMYYSTNGQAPVATLEKAVVKGLSEDKGLYMPQQIKPLPTDFYENIEKMTFHEIAFQVASSFFGEDIDKDALRNIVNDTLSFDCPVHQIN